MYPSTVYFRLTVPRSADPAPDPPPRAPVLERLLARASAPDRVEDWRADAFRIIAAPNEPMPPVAAPALYADLGAVPQPWGCFATPLHCVASMTSVRLPVDGIVPLEPIEAGSLARDFNRVFDGGGIALAAGRLGALYCLVDSCLTVSTRDPDDMRGDDILSFLPGGTDASRLRRWMSEVEMWLFDHAVNRGRAARHAPTITGLWPWGGGACRRSQSAITGWTAGCDPFFQAFGSQPRWPRRDGSRRDAGSLRDADSRRGDDSLRGGGSGVVVVAAPLGSDAWQAAEQAWLAPALDDLHAGRLTHLSLSAGTRCFSVSARSRRPFWRRARPWWEFFERCE